MKRAVRMALGLAALATVAALAPGRLVPMPPAGSPPGQQVVDRADAEPFLVAGIPSLPSAPVAVTVLTLSLAPGAASRPGAIAGPTVLLVEEGTLIVESDRPLGAAATPGPRDADPGGAAMVQVDEGQQVAIPAGARVHLRNPGRAPAELFVIAVTPRGVRGDESGFEPYAPVRREAARRLA